MRLSRLGYFHLVLQMAGRLDGKVEDVLLASRMVNFSGLAYLMLGRYPQALHFFQKAAEMLRPYSLPRGPHQDYYGGYLINIAIAFMYSGQAEKALHIYQDQENAMFFYANLNDQAIIDGLIGEAYLSLGQLDNAEAAYTRGIANFKAILQQQAFAESYPDGMHEKHFEAARWIGMGRIQMLRQEFTKAHHSFGVALELTQEIGDRSQQAEVLLQWGRLTLKEDAQGGLGQLKQALEIAQEIGNLLFQRQALEELVEHLPNYRAELSQIKHLIE
jgi:tetratricopeptide (TPR) repeat protein